MPVPLSIGVVASDLHRAAADEFFQLFKVPWSFWSPEEPITHAAILASSECEPLPNAQILICSGPLQTQTDVRLGLQVALLPEGSILKYGDMQFPVYTQLGGFDGAYDGVVARTDEGRPVAVIVHDAGTTVLRLGYDLFAEVRHLLSVGQPPEQALSPTLEIHAAILRDFLLEQGVPVVEIPPHPYGHAFVVCLTHDIDFIGIRLHKLDHTFWGFVYRSLRSVFRRKGHDWRNIERNLTTLLTLPAVYLRLVPDFWYPMDRYALVERQYPATYFFIPFARRPGKQPPSRRGYLRAAPYDVTTYAASLRRLLQQGNEVGVHGIDAWNDVDSGKEELRVLHEITHQEQLGIRMHWLYFSCSAPATLERAGYFYDSTLGYNDAVGYRNGTTQVFQPAGATILLELPLTIQDTAMFYPNRMNLSESHALDLCRRVTSDLVRFGGVLTVNWHDRSLVPERNWDLFYSTLLAELARLSPWFARARDAVSWFQRRRATEFGDVVIHNGRIVVNFKKVVNSDELSGEVPPLCLRILVPRSAYGAGRSTDAEAVTSSEFALYDTHSVTHDL